MPTASAIASPSRPRPRRPKTFPNQARPVRSRRRGGDESLNTRCRTRSAPARSSGPCAIGSGTGFAEASRVISTSSSIKRRPRSVVPSAHHLCRPAPQPTVGARGATGLEMLQRCTQQPERPGLAQALPKPPEAAPRARVQTTSPAPPPTQHRSPPAAPARSPIPRPRCADDDRARRSGTHGDADWQAPDARRPTPTATDHLAPNQTAAKPQERYRPAHPPPRRSDSDAAHSHGPTSNASRTTPRTPSGDRW